MLHFVTGRAGTGKTARVREEIVRAFRSLGYTYVSLDLAGYRTGSMNEMLPEAAAAAALYGKG